MARSDQVDLSLSKVEMLVGLLDELLLKLTDK